MNYQIYKDARRAAWDFLIENCVCALPLSFSEICTRCGISIFRDTAGVYLEKGQHGATFLRGGRFNILVSGSDSLEVQRLTIAHELGHIYMRHPTAESQLGRTFGICRKPVSPEEYQAERFAVSVLAPACVLRELEAWSAQEIAEICCIPLETARLRADRMRTLRKRDAFFSDPLEIRVYQQFRQFFREMRGRRSEK